MAGYNVSDFGAKSDGKTDCTRAFQEALDKMGAEGGGTVFVPEGYYAIRGRLKIPGAVTLRGEWQSPLETKGALKGTVLMAYADAGDESAESFISVGVSGGVRDLSIWYPEQSAERPVPYPFCLEQTGMNNATFKNLTLVNPYLGIKIGPQANELHYVNNVYGTPLKTGIRYDSTTDIGRLERIYFSPAYWLNSELSNRPRSESRFRSWLYENATAVHMLRSDWEYVDQVFIDGYRVGFMVTEGERGAANAQFRRLIIRNCETALSVDKTNPYGMVFTECLFEGKDFGVLLSPDFDSVVLFSNCILSGEHALESRGNGVVLMEQCRVQAGDIELNRGVLSMAGSNLESRMSRIKVGEDVTGVVLAGNDFMGRRDVVESRADSGVVQVSDEPLPLLEIPDYPFRVNQSYRPKSTEMIVVMPKYGDDVTAEIQAAMDRLSRSGGIVLLSGKDYIIGGNLRIPSGVELRGVHDVPHHTMAAGSVLHIYPANDQPTIVMEARSGLRGLSFNYPEQEIESVQKMPFLIQGQGSDLYIINVNAANPYRYLDLMTYACDRHFVDYISGSPLQVGVQIGGGSKGGELRNLQFNPHYWSRAPNRHPLYANKTLGGIKSGTGQLLWEYQKENMDAMVIADCEDQFLYQNFVFGSLYGIRFTGEQGPKNCISHGHGTDGSKIGVFFDHGSEQITMINSELVAMSSEDKTAIKVSDTFDAVAVLINTMVWGSPDLLAEVDGGVLVLQNLHATRHGDGVVIGDGELNATNINFLNPNGQHFSSTGTSQAKLSNVVARRQLRNSAPDQVEVEKYIERP